MTLLHAFSVLKALGQPVIRTADVVAVLRVEKAHASKVLSRLAEYGHVARVKRGLWALTDGLDPLTLVPYVTAPLPSYVSLQTALYHHGMISQIPAIIYAVSTSRTRTYVTPVAHISVHHIPPALLFGYEEVGERRIRMAVPEKALVDILYLSPARSHLFSALPEVEFPEGFDLCALESMVERVPDQRRRAMVRNRLSRVSGLGEAHHGW